MSLEDQYDAWVRGLMGGGRYAATPKQAEDANDAVQQMQAQLDALTEALLMFAARRDHVRQVIAPALARGEVVLCDRFTDATFAYQGGGRGFDWETLQILEKIVLTWQNGSQAHAYGLLQPDLTLWFDVPAATAAARLSGVRAPDKFEAQSAEFFEQVNGGYARRAAENPYRFVRIDAAQPVENVRQQVITAIRSRGWL